MTQGVRVLTGNLKSVVFLQEVGTNTPQGWNFVWSALLMIAAEWLKTNQAIVDMDCIAVAAIPPSAEATAKDPNVHDMAVLTLYYTPLL